MDDKPKITRSLPQTLCDALAVRADTLSHLRMRASVRAILNYCEGRVSYETLKRPDGLWIRIASHPTLGVTEEELSKWSHFIAPGKFQDQITPEEFQFQYAPEISFCRRAKDLLLRSTQEEFDFGLEPIIEIYLHTPSPRNEMEQLRQLIMHRKTCLPIVMEPFFWALWQGDRARAFETSRNVATAIAFASPEVKEVLSTYYATEVAMVRACLNAAINEAENQDKMEASGLDPDQTFDQWRMYLLRTYAAVRVPENRFFLWLSSS